ncbi:MAG TPA: LpqB family beta-propeller domain-containing protein [Gemmatimonadaceae bacterium]|jgi:Tol biopolymer transport system component
MRRSLFLFIPLLTTTLAAQSRPVVRQSKPSFAEPSITPDRSEIAFVSGGDIWVVPFAGGAAHLLVSHPATESRPMYSPDGTRLAFMSNRAGSMDIWILTFATGDVRQLTFDDGNEQLDGWSHDGNWIYFSSSAHDVGSNTDVYRVRATGGTPMSVSADRYAAEFMSAPSPDGSQIAVVARGMGQSQWWRKGHSHLDESEIWLVKGDGSRAPTYKQLLARNAKQQWPMWSADGSVIYYVSDQSGAQNIWMKPLRGEAKRLTTFTDGRVLFPSIDAAGREIVFERDFAIWRYEIATNQAQPVPIMLRGAAATNADQHLVITNGLQQIALSPDGKKLAFIARGEVFVARADSGGDALHVTRTPAAEAELAWAPDSRRVAYASNRDGAWHLYVHDLTSGQETQLTTGDKSDVNPRWSPDGSRIAFLRDARELRVLDVATHNEQKLATSVFGRPPFLSERPIAWSPDGRYVAYLGAGTKLMVNAYVVPVGGGASTQVTWLSNTRANTLSWSADGTYLILDSGMRTEPGIAARVDLVPRTPRIREDLLAAMFRDTTPGRATPAPAPQAAPRTDTSLTTPAREPRAPRATRVVAEGMRERLAVLPVGVDVTSEIISPDGRQLLLVASAAGQQQLFTYSLDELMTEPAIARQLTSTPGFKSSIQWAPDSKSVWFLEQGRVVNMPVESRQPRQVVVRAEMDVDFSREKMEVFNQAWEFLNDNFYDPNFHGANWNAVREAYAPIIAGAKTPDEMRRLLNLMIGEMNASHMGISGPGGGTGLPGSGRLGLHFERAAYEQRGELKVTEVIPLSPAALSDRIHVGDYILSVDGARVGPGFNLDSALSYKFDHRVDLSVAADAGGRDKRQVGLRATNGVTEKGLLYREWIADRRAYVERISNGRLGYVHMNDMGGSAIAQMNLDLGAEEHAKEGVVLDIRFNNGGFVNGYALDVLSRQPYVQMVRRGVPAVPGRPVLGQRALEAPTILVTNQATLSDGENFTEGYRTMKLGKVVGEPTAGWDVYTGAGTMVDGTSVRLPFMMNASQDGKALELVPRAVDIRVDRPLGESYTGRDSQLDAAVKELLAEIDARGGRRSAASGK